MGKKQGNAISTAPAKNKLDAIAFSLHISIRTKFRLSSEMDMSVPRKTFLLNDLDLNLLTLSEIFTVMQLTFFSPSVRAIGVMFLLSVMVGTSVPQSAQANAEVPTGAEATCVPLAEGEIVFAFRDITFTPEQAAAYDILSVKVSAQAAAMEPDLQTAEIPGTPPDIVMRAGAPAGIAQAIVDAHDEMIRNNVSVDEQLTLLTQRYGQYAIFSKPQRVVFTPETLARRDEINREHEADIMAILTPEQQAVFRANLVRVRQFEACNPFTAG